MPHVSLLGHRVTLSSNAFTHNQQDVDGATQTLQCCKNAKYLFVYQTCRSNDRPNAEGEQHTVVAVHQHAPPARQVPRHKGQRRRQARAQRRAVPLRPRDRQPQVARGLGPVSSAFWPIAHDD